jgi:hypothetical protein
MAQGTAYMYTMTWTMWDGPGFPVFTSMTVPESPRRAIRSGLPPRVPASPLREKPFCLSVNTSQLSASQRSRASLTIAVWAICHPARSKSPGTCSQLPLSWRALNQAAHSHEFSPASSLVSHVTQK